MLYERLGLSQRNQYMQGGNQAYNHFIHHPDVLKAYDAKDAFDNINQLMANNSSVGYGELFGGLARMSLPNNARAVGTMLSRLYQSGALKGPFNPQENVLLTLNRLANSQGTLPLSPEMRQNVYSTALAMLGPHIKKHDQVKDTITKQLQTEGVPYDSTYLEAIDPFADVRSTLQQRPMAPIGPNAPSGTGNQNPIISGTQ